MAIEKKTQDRIEAIKKLLRENKEGMWLSEIAKVCEIPLGSINYIIFGQVKKGKKYGGYIEKDIGNKLEVVTEGKNKKIKLIY
jgi:predicted transcriptional regulator